jgi:methylated-DNA-[protein]-cysteine S-methyltransferase
MSHQRTPARPLALAQMNSPIGALSLGALDGALIALALANESSETFALRLQKRYQRPAQEQAGEPAIAAAIEQLEAYFAGRSPRFDLPLWMHGTALELQVWRYLLTIPCGETRSYATVARELGRPLAARGVGRANARNPIPIIVPCHRLIGSNGALTGYSGGLAVKRWLIEHERGLGSGQSL